MSFKKKILPRKQGTKVLHFLSAAFTDYIAARVLLNSGLLLQGAVLASTSLEKYLKAIMALHGNESRGHLKKAHWNALKNHSTALYEKLNQAFLQLCQKCYRLRYTDKLPLDFNLVIAQFEFLTELDHSVSLIENSIKTVDQGRNQIRAYQAAVECKDQRLYANNIAVQKLQRVDIDKGFAQMVYEVRNCRQRGLIELHYGTISNPIREGFLREGCVTKDGYSYTTAFEYKPSAG
jgi:HEPN domain-containing protein